MRFVILQQAGNWHSLGEQLLQPGLNAATTLERLKALNPHLDLGKLAAGSLLLLPDTPNGKSDASASPGSTAFEGFAADVNDALSQAAGRARAGVASVAADRAGVAAFLKSTPAKRLIEGDPQLKKQVEDADLQFKLDQTRAQDTAKQIDALQAQAAQALQALSGLIR
jgi:hypothetical protein